jgi:hypothetical protein
MPYGKRSSRQRPQPIWACIGINTPPSIVLAVGITATVEIEHRARTE